jgi:hypothetical protein
MESITSKVAPGRKISVDFSIVPAGIILLEISAFLIEILKFYKSSSWNLISARFLHLVFLLLLSYTASKILKTRNIRQLLIHQIVILGLFLSFLSFIAYHLIFLYFDLKTFTFVHEVLLIILQGTFWFPILMIIGGSGSEIIAAFKGYEERLLVQTRKSVKKSEEFQGQQKQIEDRIRQELILESKKINDVLQKIDINQELSQINTAAQQVLSGKELRALSLRLGRKANFSDQATFLGQNIHSLLMVSKQFRILYSVTAKNSPLNEGIYVGLLLALIAPSYINFFTVTETLSSLPLLLIATYLIAKLINKILISGSKNAIFQSSILILLIGYLPFIVNQIGQSITTNPRTSFPILITALFFPVSYHFVIRFLQILQPKAIDLMSGDQLEASSSLTYAINEIVTEELSQTISHRWAIYIHGKVLTKLAATSLKCEQSVLTNDRDSLLSALLNMEKLLTNPIADFDEAPLTLEKEIETRLNPWEGLLSISIYIEPSLASIKNEKIRNLGEAVEEIVSNSIRHGGATTITLKITQINQTEIEVLVEDDAVNRPSEFPTRVGLGTKIFNLVSDGRWSLEYKNLSAQFKMIVAIAE